MKNKIEIAKSLLSELVYTRFKKSELTSLIIRKLIDLNVSKVGWSEVKTSELLEDEDYKIGALVLFDNNDNESFYFTLYYLKTRNKQIFVTEISFD